MDETIVQIQVRFTLVDADSGASFTDALYYPLASWPVRQEQIEAEKQARFAAWQEALATPSPGEPTSDEPAPLQ